MKIGFLIMEVREHLIQGFVSQRPQPSIAPILRECWPNPYNVETPGCSVQKYKGAWYNICRSGVFNFWLRQKLQECYCVSVSMSVQHKFVKSTQSSWVRSSRCSLSSISALRAYFIGQRALKSFVLYSVNNLSPAGVTRNTVTPPGQ